MAAEAGAEGTSTSRPLEYTPTWAVATVCTIYVVASLILERGLHRLGTWLTKTKRKPLYETLEKMKEELMLLGFISLLLTVTADYVARICVKTSLYNKQPTPCKLTETTAGHRRKLLEYFLTEPSRRNLVVSAGKICPQVCL
ncbi:hypothetical protein O6H91_Y216900 [Diphasiastrum complanatum]|nr:hypothetical protein O6H91_Y216900 [Diphasiastrum complanatum]